MHVKVGENHLARALTTPDLTQQDRIKSTPRLFEELQQESRKQSLDRLLRSRHSVSTLQCSSSCESLRDLSLSLPHRRMTKRSESWRPGSFIFLSGERDRNLRETSFVDSGTNEAAIERGQEIHANAQTAAIPLETLSPLETPRLLQVLELEPREQALARIRTSRRALSDRKSPNGLDGLAFLQTKRLGFEGKERKNVRVNAGANSELLSRVGCVSDKRKENVMRALTFEDPSSPAPRSLHVSSKLLTSVWVEVEGLNTFGEHLITGLTENALTHSPSFPPFSIAAPRFWP